MKYAVVVRGDGWDADSFHRFETKEGALKFINGSGTDPETISLIKYEPVKIRRAMVIDDDDDY